MFVNPSFPNEVWDGLSENTYRESRADTVDPDYNDWDRLVAELIATQQEVANAEPVVTIEVGDQEGDDVEVVITVEDAEGNPLAGKVIEFYLSDEDDGADLANSGAEAVSFDSGTVLIEATADLQWKLETDESGEVAITFTETGELEVYPVVLFKGVKTVGDPIAFDDGE